VGCAASRQESRGLHATIDYPNANDRSAADTVTKRGVPPHLRGR
jgi:L-aspartate oxidase